MSKITISKTHIMGESEPPLFWAFQVPENSSVFDIVEVDGYRVAQTKRNYFYGKSTDQKIHFTKMRAEQSSAKFYCDIYIEVSPKIFSYAGICTDKNITDKISHAISRAKLLESKQISEWKKELKYLN